MTDTAAVLYRASALRDLGQLDQAIACLGTALATAPDDPQLLGALADLLLLADRVEEAASAAEAALAVAPDDADLMLSLARIMARRGDLFRMTRFAREAIRLDPDEPAGHLMLAIALASGPWWAVRDRRQARESYRRALRLGESASAYSIAADVEIMLRNRDAAAALVAAGLEQYPTDLDLQLNLAELAPSTAKSSILAGILAVQPLDGETNEQLTLLFHRTRRRTAMLQWCTPVVLALGSAFTDGLWTVLVFAAVWAGVIALWLRGRTLIAAFPSAFLAGRRRNFRGAMAVTAISWLWLPLTAVGSFGLLCSLRLAGIAFALVFAGWLTTHILLAIDDHRNSVHAPYVTAALPAAEGTTVGNARSRRVIAARMTLGMPLIGLLILGMDSWFRLPNLDTSVALSVIGFLSIVSLVEVFVFLARSNESVWIVLCMLFLLWWPLLFILVVTAGGLSSFAKVHDGVPRSSAISEPSPAFTLDAKR